MDLQAEILKEHSKRQTVRISRWVGGNPARFNDLMKLFLAGDRRTTQRSSWIVSCTGERHPELITPWLMRMLKRMKEPDVHPAAARNVLRVMTRIELPGNLLGRVTSICFDELASPQSPTAVRAYALVVLANIAEKEPDIIREIRATTELILPHAGPGVQACIRKLRTKLTRIERAQQNS